FSIAGVSKHNALGIHHGFQHPTQGNLFFQIARILKDKRPRAFLLENVKHLQNHDSGRTFRKIQHILNDLGYYTYYQVINAVHFVPQHRERIFIVGFREPLEFTFPRLPIQKHRVKDILEFSVDAKYTLSDRLWQYLQNYAKKHRVRGNGFGYGLVDLEGVTRTLSARYYKDGSEILIPQENNNPRRLTPRECARLMGFPDSFKIVVSDTRAYQQFGNSVVVPLVKVIADEILKSLDQCKILVQTKQLNLF
ncbi:MAG: DNA (cytosine-5-)-methyltransferase, partial [Acinetobacter sp.]